MPYNPYQKYKEQSVMTMTPGEMLLKLYDEVIKQLIGAQDYIAEKDYIKANVAMQKAQKIINYLRSTLDYKYEIAGNLASLYDYFNRQIVGANVRKDARPLREVIPMVTELREAYAQAERLARVQ